MVKAFEAPGQPGPTVTWVGEVYEVTEEAFSMVVRDDHVNGEEKTAGWYRLDNIIESERPQVQPGMLFYCEVELLEEGDIKKIWSIEFSEGLTARLLSESFGLLGDVIAKAEERKF